MAARLDGGHTAGAPLMAGTHEGKHVKEATDRRSEVRRALRAVDTYDVGAPRYFGILHGIQVTRGRWD